MCFLRHLSEDDALDTLEQARPFAGELLGVGLNSGELGNPPGKFERVFAQARELGLHVVAHADEEGPAAYISEALDRLLRDRVPLTVCPLSNLKLKVVSSLANHNLKRLLRRLV